VVMQLPSQRLDEPEEVLGCKAAGWHILCFMGRWVCSATLPGGACCIRLGFTSPLEAGAALWQHGMQECTASLLNGSRVASKLR
jgi:hypothetical protein